MRFAFAARFAVALVPLIGCGSPTPSGDDDVLAPDSMVIPPEPEPVTALEVQALGVQGFALRYGNDTVLSAPLFTRQSMFEVALATPLPANHQAIDDGLAGIALDQIRAVISGHAHYDHFMDVPRILERAPNAVAYTNLSGRNMLAALAPDRPAGCSNTPASPLERARVVALDDALASAKPRETPELDVPPSGARAT